MSFLPPAVESVDWGLQIHTLYVVLYMRRCASPYQSPSARSVDVATLSLPGTACEAYEASGHREGTGTSAASKREKANRVSKGDGISYMLATPSIAPSAIALVAYRPARG